MNVISLSLVGMMVMTHAGPVADAEQTVRDYRERLYRDRTEITHGYLEYTLTIETEEKDRNLEGSVTNFRHWFEKDRYRIDRKEVRPNDPANAMDARFSCVDGTYRMVPLDAPTVLVNEFTKAYLGGKEPALMPWANFDPRLIGVIGMEFGLLQHNRLDELKSIDPNVTFHADYGDGPGVADRLSIHYSHGGTKTYTVTEASLLPSKLIWKFAKTFPDGRLSPETRVEIDSEVVSMPNSRGERFEFPRMLKMRRIVDGQTTRAQTLEIRKADFNVPIDPSVYTWKGLGPLPGVGIMRDGQYRMSLIWTGETFEDVPIEARRPPEADLGVTAGPTQNSILRRSSYILLGIAALLATMLLLTKTNKGWALA